MRLPTTGTSTVDATGKSPIFLDYISQARQQIQELELFFSKQLYPAVESNLKDSESAVAELRSNFAKAQQLWLEEKRALTRDLDDAVLEKEAAIRSRESAESRVKELEKQLAEKQEIVAELERERASLQCDSRRLNRNNSKLEEQWRNKSRILTSLNSRYMRMKRFLKNNGMYKRFEEYEQAQREVKGYGSDEGAEFLKLPKVGEPAEPVCKVDEVRHQAEPVWNWFMSDTTGDEEHHQAEAVTKPKIDEEKHAGAAPEAVWKRSKAEEEHHQVAKRSKNDEAVSKTSKNDETTSKRCKSGQVESASKRSKSRAEPEAGWRTTRAEGSKATHFDPHDDFLSTPQELALQRLAAALKNEVLAVDEPRRPVEAPTKPGPRKAAPESARKQQQRGPLYKYVEPVRKKADREALQGVDCNQCRKFYEAVSAHDAQGAKRSRCEEHHDAVSRHRYRYAPPGTPEGFWDITFDSPS